MENSSIEAASELDDNESRAKKFMMRLVSALHSSGNLSYKTEYFIERVAAKYNLRGTCIIFPVSAILSFTTMSASHPLANESYTFRIRNGFDCAKLSRLDQLCFDILKRDLDLFTAEDILDRIEQAPALYVFCVYAEAVLMRILRSFVDKVSLVC